MSGKKARRKLARKVIDDLNRREHVPAYISANPRTHDLDDREFDRLVQEIRAATVTVTWPHKKGRHK